MEKETKIQIERRRAPRLSLQIKFKYKILGPSDTAEVWHRGLSKNINTFGLVFENTKEVPLDAKIKFALELPDVFSSVLQLEARVVRIEKVSAALFEIGVIFENISEQAEEKIRAQIERMNVLRLLEKAKDKGVSDLHLSADNPPMVRCYGKIKSLEEEPLTAEELRQLIYTMLSEEQKDTFQRYKDIDFALAPSPDLRYRVSIYQQRGRAEVVFRRILPHIKTREELGLPDVLDDLCQLREGLVFISGPTGSGKTTTISTMINYINHNRAGVILSLEKPIEYLHKNIKGIVKQREVGVDVPTFVAGLKAALKQDADVLVVGEVLDADTMETAMQASETGHLVITSIHGTDTVQVLERILSLFPPEQRDFVASRLAHSLKAIINQRLLPHKSGVGRVVATEVCVANTAVKRIVRNMDLSQLLAVIETASQFKMQLLENSIENLFKKDLISAETYDLFTKKVAERYTR